MAKELIISANVHEKKVAIIEDGVVTEFYVERRDDEQGLVGNIYKGRVMKVLPGMQSAFVDIALERDAFLYVSDFTDLMEDEEEIDFRDMGAEKPARREDRARPTERVRTRTAVATAPSAEATIESVKDEEPEAVVVPIDDVVEQLAEIADESLLIPPPEEEEATPEVVEGELPAVEEAAVEEPLAAVDEEAAASEEAGKPKRGRARKKAAEPEPRKTTRGKKRAESVEEIPVPTSQRRSSRAKKLPAEVEESPDSYSAEAATPQSQFERITDEDLVAEAGEHLKDALMQEKIIERVHEAEYQVAETKPAPEPEPEWRVGSLRPQWDDPSGFERVVDESHRLAHEDESREPTAEPNEPLAHTAEDHDDNAEPALMSEAGEDKGAPFRHISQALPASLYERIAAEAESQAAATDEPFGEEDREAAVHDFSSRAEFALRRGGRGRRRSGRRPYPPQEEERSEPAAAEPVEGEAENGVETAPAEVSPRFLDKPSAPMRKPDRRGAPSISDLLHEGQEIIVQIAKEPIAKKGARITSHIALPGRYLVYMPTVNHVGVSRKIPSDQERIRLKKVVSSLREREAAQGGFIARTACAGHTEQELHDDMRYLLRTWSDIKKKGERLKPPTLIHRDLDLVQRILRDQLSDDFTAIRVDSDVEYANIVEFVNRVQPRLVKRVKLYTGNQPILEKYTVQPEIDKAVRPRVWLKSGGYIVINQTEALVAIDVNTGKFVGKSDKLEDTITRTNMEAAKEIVRQIRLRDLGGIIVIDFIDMEERKNRQRVMTTLQQELQTDRSPSKILSINDFGLVAITRKRVRQSLERTLCAPCPYCTGAGMVKSAQTMCFEILEQAKALSRQVGASNEVMLRVAPQVAEAFRSTESQVFEEVEAYFGIPVMIEADPNLHQEQYDFAII